MHRTIAFAFFLAFTLLWGTSFAAITDQDRQAIQNTIETYVKAFNEGDVDTLMQHWAENGDYIDVSGRQLKGKEQIRAAYKEFFANAPDPRVQIELTSLAFADENIAIEDGYRDVSTSPMVPAHRIRYTAVHVKHKGEWYVQSVRDAVSFPLTNYEHLQGLEWAVGTWESEGENGAIMRSVCSWDESQNFLIREYATILQDQEISSGIQWIGWDPAEETVRSWHFDSTGGFGGGTWKQDGERWIATATSTLRTGQKLVETHILSLVDENTLSWSSKDRSLDGEPLPDTPEVTVKRQMQ